MYNVDKNVAVFCYPSCCSTYVPQVTPVGGSYLIITAVNILMDTVNSVK